MKQILIGILSVAMTATWSHQSHGQRPDRPDGSSQRRPDRERSNRQSFRLPTFALMQALDENGDGKLSSKEIANASATLKKLDKNKDGKLGRDEIGWPPPGFGGPRGGDPRQFGGRPPARGNVARIKSDALLKRYDKNKNGKLEKSEVPAFLWKRFAPADANGDSVITPNEFAAFKKGDAKQKQSKSSGDKSTKKKNNQD